MVTDRLLTAVDLSSLPPPDVVEALDYEAIRAEILQDYEGRYPEFTAALESEPVVKLIEAFAYREMLLRQRVNDGARAVLLASAIGADLDNLAALFGVTRADGETDARLRRRAALAVEGFGAAGPVGAYRFFALTAAPEVKDVSATSPAPGAVRVALLGAEGSGAVASDIVARVRDALNADTVRPLTDIVEVQSAEIVEYEIEAGLTIYPGPSSDPIVQRAQAAVTKYAEDRHQLGHDITISGLHAALHVEGVQHVELRKPADLPLGIGPKQAAWANKISVIFDGRAE